MLHSSKLSWKFEIHFQVLMVTIQLLMWHMVFSSKIEITLVYSLDEFHILSHKPGKQILNKRNRFSLRKRIKAMRRWKNKDI